MGCESDPQKESDNAPEEPEEGEASVDVLHGQVARLRQALIWCGGSADFGPGGTAEEGWKKIVAPLLSRLPDKHKLFDACLKIEEPELHDRPVLAQRDRAALAAIDDAMRALEEPPGGPHTGAHSRAALSLLIETAKAGVRALHALDEDGGDMEGLARDTYEAIRRLRTLVEAWEARHAEG